MSRVVVVGAGVSGTTAAFLLCEAGHEVTVLERENSVGGLARTFRYGSYSFDIGPHRFHTDDLTVLRFLHRILESNWAEIDRKSGVWMYGKYHDWPLRPSSVLKLPFPFMLSTGLDLFRRRSREDDSFKGYILGMYGRTLYQLFFGPYTRKFIREDPELIHSDWAISGIDRAVIDKRVQMNTLSQVIRGALLPRAVTTKFIYPATGGVGYFCGALRKGIEEMGGRVLTRSRVVAASASGGLVDSVIAESGDRFPLDLLIWTAPTGELAEILGLPRTWL
ncbi:MAG: FAD-dependent oxidoreductase, partial [bacterium]